MSRPHPALVDLALGRPLGERACAAEVMRSAFDHRMQGLLWSQVRDGRAQVTAADRSQLAGADLLQQRTTRRHWEILAKVQSQLVDRGLPTVALKGVAAEARWYDRLGERPTSDIDLWLDPHAIDRFPEAVAVLDPSHPLRDSIGAMIAAGDCQGIEVAVPGATVDLHADPYKVRARLPGIPGMFERRIEVKGPQGSRAWVLAPEDALLQHLVHLHRDWFRHLLGYVDIHRIVQRSSIDWDALWRRCEADGLTDLVVLGLQAVDRQLPLGTPPPAEPGGWRRNVWHRAWPERIRLSGHDDAPRERRRNDVITLLLRGHAFRTLRAQSRTRLFPSRSMVEHAYPGRGGPYLWRLLSGRVGSLRSAWRRG